MEGSVDAGAKKLGERLLVEVQVEGLSSVLKSLGEYRVERDETTTTQPTPRTPFFNIPPLDQIISKIPSSSSSSCPILELISPPFTHHPSNSGKTSLVHLIITHALLPSTFSNDIKIHGKTSAVILFDPLHHFSVPRLAEVMFHHLLSSMAPGVEVTPDIKSDMKSTVQEALKHLHIFRPRTWTSLLATLASLPDYLFDSKRHQSTNRPIHSLILEDIDLFTWEIRHNPQTTNNHDNNDNHDSSSSSSNSANNALTSASTILSTNLTSLSNNFSCAIILTSSSPSPTLRPALPTTWPPGAPPTVKLGVRRVEVVRFALGMGVEEAEAERDQRWDVVSRGRFSCWRLGREGVGDGFEFTVGSGVGVERG